MPSGTISSKTQGKTRASRVARVRGAVGAAAGQVVGTTEFMHPRVPELLATLPADARLWLQPDGDAVDWALAAEILLTHESALRPHQVDGLRAFIVAEREASFARLNSAFHRPETGGAVLRAPGG